MVPSLTSMLMLDLFMSWQGHNAHSEWPAAAWCLATASPQLPPPAFLVRVTWPAVLLGATQTSEQPTYVLCMAASPPHSRTPGRLGHTTALTAITQSLRDAGGSRAHGASAYVFIVSSVCLYFKPSPPTFLDTAPQIRLLRW